MNDYSFGNKLIAAWTGHPHLRVIDNSTGFENKMKRLISEIAGFLGEPEPYEIERKYLIEYPDIAALEKREDCQKVEIIQTYLKTEGDEEVRVRQRGADGSYIYFKTIKKTITLTTRVETEERLSQAEYLKLLMEADTSLHQIRKTRYCLTYESQYFEIDIYPFWDDKAIAEIELLDETEEVFIPDFLKVIKEVTNDLNYKNIFLAKNLKEVKNMAKKKHKGKKYKLQKHNHQIDNLQTDNHQSENYQLDNQETKQKTKRKATRVLAISIFLLALGLAIPMGMGILQDHMEISTALTIIALVGMFGSFLLSIYFLIHNMDVFIDADLDKNDKYDHVPLYELSLSKDKLMNHFIKNKYKAVEPNRFCKKKLHLLKDSITYHVSIVESDLVSNTISEETEYYHRTANPDKNCCQLIFIIVNTMTKDKLEYIRFLGKTQINLDSIIPQNNAHPSIVILVDKANSKGYFLDINRRVSICNYAIGCRYLKKCFL